MTATVACRTCERLAAERPKWGPGPWQGEPDRIEFEAHGLPCILHRGGLGNWCGYAAVPPGHPFHGKSYDDIGADIAVHGGLTYANACEGHICHVPKPGDPDNVWWFGFDCAHCDDLVPSMPSSLRDGEYRDLDYAKAETIRLAEQLSKAV